MTSISEARMNEISAEDSVRIQGGGPAGDLASPIGTGLIEIITDAYYWLTYKGQG